MSRFVSREEKIRRHIAAIEVLLNQPAFLERPCDHCGALYEYKNRHSRFCSDSHRVLANRKAKAAPQLHLYTGTLK